MTLRLALLLLLLPAVLAAQPRRKGTADPPPPPPPPNAYCNDRFTFGIDVPEGLMQQPPPANGDGATWLSADSTVEFRAWGENDAVPMKEMMGIAAERMSKTTLKRKGRDWFVLSGTLPDNRILYRRTRMWNDGWVSFELVYPVAQRKTYDPLCQKLAESITTCMMIEMASPNGGTSGVPDNDAGL